MNKGPAKNKCHCGKCSGCRHRASKRKYYNANRDRIVAKQAVRNAERNAVVRARRERLAAANMKDPYSNIDPWECENWCREAAAFRRDQQTFTTGTSALHDALL
jgi:hypothetical protein